MVPSLTHSQALPLPPGFNFAPSRAKIPLLLPAFGNTRGPGTPEPAGIGFVVFVPHGFEPPLDGVELIHEAVDGRWFHSYLAVPDAFMQRFVEREQYIGQLELLGAVAVYYTLPHLLRGRHVVHYIDNASAMAALVKGYSGAPDSARIIHSFWALATGLRVVPWFEWVASDANVADWPSRGDCKFAEAELRSEWCETELPDIDVWGSVEEALARASAVSADDEARRPSRRRRRSH
jgi:hypothetical protein